MPTMDLNPFLPDDDKTPRDLIPIDSVCDVCLVDIGVEDHLGWCPKA